MAFKKTFVLSDESLNSYGFWIPVAGMDLSRVQKNCPLYYNHRTWEIPCGHVENIRLKADQVLGDVVIEGGNEIEKEYIRKIENGDIKGCSFGFDPIEWSEAVDMVKPGQTRATLSKCSPYELSLAPLPGNANALVLRNGKDLISLSADNHYDFIPDLNDNSNMKEVAILLGMSETSTAAQLCDALRPIMLKAQSADAVQKVVEDKLSDGLPEEDKKFFLTLCKTSLTSAVEFLNLKKAPAQAVTTELVVATAEPGVIKKETKITDLIQLGKKPAAEAAADGKDSFDYMQKHNTVELSRIKSEEPEKYAELVSAYGQGVRYKA